MLSVYVRVQVLAVTNRLRRSAAAQQKDRRLDPVAILLSAVPITNDKAGVPRTQKIGLRLPLFQMTIVDDAELGQNLLRVSVSEVRGSLRRCCCVLSAFLHS